MFRALIRKFKRGTPVNVVSNVQDHNRIGSFINSIRGMGCRVIVKAQGDNLDAMVVVDGKSTDVVPPDGSWPFGDVTPVDPDPYTTIGSATEGSESASTDTWTYGDTAVVDGVAKKKGVHLHIQTRQGFFNEGDHKWYAYDLVLKFSSKGLLYSIGVETRLVIDEPVNHADL